MKLIVAIIFYFILNSVFAADWIFVNSIKNGAKVYTTETYVLEDDTVRTYLKIIKGKNSSDPFAILINCSQRLFRNYVPGGLGSEFHEPWQPIIPDSAYEVAVNFHCKDFKTYKELLDIKKSSLKENSTPSNKDSNSINSTYVGRLRARIKPNIIFSDIQLNSVIGNPDTEVEVTCSPNGQIVNKRLLRSSGHDGWDSAVLNAIDKAGSLPRDEMGNIPSKITFVFRPKD